MSETLLVVEDSSAQRLVLVEKLVAKGYDVLEATSGEEATRLLKENPVSAVILDWELPDTKGPELLQGWSKTFEDQLKFTPFLMLTGKTNSTAIQTALDAGAMDYLKKPACDVELFARLENALRMRKLQLQLIDVAVRDPLTKLYNRRYLQDYLNKQIGIYRQGKSPLTCAILDIDFFKKINDNFGHQIGDEVLQKMAQILMVKSRHDDVVARYGGEEFVICYPHTTGQKANLLAIRTLEEVRNFNWSQIAEGLSVTFSCGISEFHDGFDSIEKWIASADNALYFVKEVGRNNVILDRNITRHRKVAS